MTGSPDPPQPQMRRVLFMSSIMALLLLVVVTVAVVTDSAVASKIGPAGLFQLLLFGGVALIASLATTEVIPWGARALEHWLGQKY